MHGSLGPWWLGDEGEEGEGLNDVQGGGCFIISTSVFSLYDIHIWPVVPDGCAGGCLGRATGVRRGTSECGECGCGGNERSK